MASNNNLEFEVIMQFNDWLVLFSEFMAAKDPGEATALVSPLGIVCDSGSAFVAPPTILQVSQDEPAVVIKSEGTLVGTKTKQGIPLWQDDVSMRAGPQNNTHSILSLVIEPELKPWTIFVS